MITFKVIGVIKKRQFVVLHPTDDFHLQNFFTQYAAEHRHEYRKSFIDGLVNKSYGYFKQQLNGNEKPTDIEIYIVIPSLMNLEDYKTDKINDHEND